MYQVDKFGSRWQRASFEEGDEEVQHILVAFTTSNVNTFLRKKDSHFMMCAGPVWSERVVPATGPAQVLPGAEAAGAP